MTYQPRTTPFRHQAEEVRDHGTDASRGLFWEQGCGKSWVIVTTAGLLYKAGEINGLVVLAPNGVHRNWVSDELPTHLGEDVFEQTTCHVWYSSQTKAHAQSFAQALLAPGLAVLVMSYNALLTTAGQEAWKTFLKTRRCLYVLDESHYIKNPAAKWTKRVIGSASIAAPYNRILTGTPVANSPFDLYSQLRFLDKQVWADLGIRSFAGFKQFFGIWEVRKTRDDRNFPVCVAYRNANILSEKLATYGSRLTKDEVLDLPPKLYSKRYFTLTPAQNRLYQQLRDDMIAELDSGEELTAILAIVRLIRLQQVTCGYLPSSDGEDARLRDIIGPNPRLDLLAETCEPLGHKAIIWCRFRRDIEKIMAHPVFMNRSVRIDGSVTGEARGEAIDRFQQGGVQFLVANPAAISTGVTLHAARTVIYYSNSFNLTHRLQSEDRAHRIGQKHPVHYIDLVCPGTVDMRIVEALRKKVELASVITGDTLREWL